jgi:hypothetical protein
MNQVKIASLTSEQNELIPLYRNKWQHLVLSTERIDRQKVVETMRSAYHLMNEEEPKFIICDSPYQALNYVSTDLIHLGRRIEKKIRRPLREQIESQLTLELIEDLHSRLRPNRIMLQGQMESCVEHQLDCRKFISASHFLDISILYDIAISILDCICDRKKGGIIRSILENCSWVLPYSKICIICDRPTKIYFRSFEDGEYIHADREAAIQFADGFNVCVYHGKITDKLITKLEK